MTTIEHLLRVIVALSAGILYGLMVTWRTKDKNLGIATGGLMGVIILLGNW